MSGEILVALIGATASIIAAWLGSRRKLTASAQPDPKKTFFAVILALGLSLTGIAIGLYSYFQTTRLQLRVITGTYAAHTVGASGDTTYRHLLAPNVPASAQKHVLEMQCPAGYVPIAAWHEVTGSNPSAADTMYSTDASVENNHIVLYLRAREGGGGYSYVQVTALCSRLGA